MYELGLHYLEDEGEWGEGEGGWGYKICSSPSFTAEWGDTTGWGCYNIGVLKKKGVKFISVKFTLINLSIKCKGGM